MSNSINGLENEESIALSVIKDYRITPIVITMIQGGTIKTVWKVKAENGVFCLKRLKQPYEKASFSVNAQIHIKQSGGNVPGIIFNKSDQPITQYNGQLFVLYEWVEGADLNFSNSSDLKASIQGLASFHTYSKGYDPDEASRISTKLGKWPEQYASMLEKLACWEAEAKVKASQQNYAAYLKYTPSIIKIGKMALDTLKASKYDTLTCIGSDSIVLCHQDYGKGNAILTEKGVCVLDLDGVTFDLPARDLRKIIGKNAENKYQWQPETIKEICGWYEEINPLGNDVREILYMDLLFPHWYYGLVKNLFQVGKAVKGEQIERIAKLEESKVPILTSLFPKQNNPIALRYFFKE